MARLVTLTPGSWLAVGVDRRPHGIGGFLLCHMFAVHREPDCIALADSRQPWLASRALGHKPDQRLNGVRRHTSPHAGALAATPTTAAATHHPGAIVRIIAESATALARHKAGDYEQRPQSVRDIRGRSPRSRSVRAVGCCGSWPAEMSASGSDIHRSPLRELIPRS